MILPLFWRDIILEICCVKNNCENKLIDILTVVYLLALSLFLYPIFQEYFDPLILLMAFTFFNSKLKINYKSSIILYIYLFLMLIGSNIYYENLLKQI